MPRIELIDDVLFDANEPIHWETDNIPLKNIIRRQELINLAVDNLAEQMRDAIGTAGSFSNRLNQSLEENGSLKTLAVDDANHSIESHTDGDTYVRMQKTESDKLANIEEEANKLTVEVASETSTEEFSSGKVSFVTTPTVEVRAESGQQIEMHLRFSEEAAHQHYWDQTPVDSDITDPDYMNYKVNSIGTPYVEGSLKVIVNGVVLTKSSEVYVPAAMVNEPWTLLSYTEDSENGSFTLSAALSDNDVVRIDYMISLAVTETDGSNSDGSSS